MEKVKEKLPTRAECRMLSEAVHDLLSSTPSMSGGLLIHFKGIQKKLDLINKETFNKQETVIKKHVKLDKKGGFILTTPTEEEMMQGNMPEYVYKSDDSRQKAEVELKKLYDGEVKTRFKKIKAFELATLQVNPSRNPKFAVIMDNLLEDLPEEAPMTIE
jgi:hypothetical protein